MKRIYLYMHHCGFDFYMTDYEQTQEEIYCPDCDESSELIGICDNEAELEAKITELFSKGYDIITFEKCDDISSKIPRYNDMLRHEQTSHSHTINGGANHEY